jgi:hypothetical protein
MRNCCRKRVGSARAVLGRDNWEVRSCLLTRGSSDGAGVAAENQSLCVLVQPGDTCSREGRTQRLPRLPGG